MLLSSSRDTSLKLWELETQHCVQTVVGHKNEVWTFDLSKDNQYLVSGGSELEVYVWKIEPHHPSKEHLSDSEDEDLKEAADSEDDVSMTVMSDTSSNLGTKPMTVSAIS